MKKIVFTAFVALASGISLGQNTFPSTGNTGIGIATPTGNLHIHGTTDYIYNLPPDRLGNPGGTANTGKTSRIALTNNATGVGSLSTDGALLRMSATNLVLENLEDNGNLQLRVGGASLYVSGLTDRFYIGAITPSTSAVYGRFNIQTADNGLYIQTGTGKYGLTIISGGATDKAIQVFASNGTTRNFKVNGNGEVFARKYTTTLTDIPDYVFDPAYKLMPLTELRVYLQANRHLPNVPSADEYTQTGVDLGEMNRVLLEKTEELTLYILQLETRLKALEDKK